jgi:hypothetical protein
VNIGSYSQHWLNNTTRSSDLPSKAFQYQTAQNTLPLLASQMKFQNSPGFHAPQVVPLEDAPGGKDYITKDEPS